MIEQMTAGLFSRAALESRRCIRCSKLIPKLSIFFKSEGSDSREGQYALLAQVLNNGHLKGGLLCVRCVNSFTEWMSRKDDE